MSFFKYLHSSFIGKVEYLFTLFLYFTLIFDFILSIFSFLSCVFLAFSHPFCFCSLLLLLDLACSCEWLPCLTPVTRHAISCFPTPLHGIIGLLPPVVCSLHRHLEPPPVPCLAFTVSWHSAWNGAFHAPTLLFSREYWCCPCQQKVNNCTAFGLLIYMSE